MYEIVNEEVDGKIEKIAVVKFEYEGKPSIIKLRQLTFREQAYALDEFLSYSNKGVVMKIGNMILSLIPKSIISAPFDLTDTNSLLEKKISMNVTLEIINAIMDLNGLKEKKNE